MSPGRSHWYRCTGGLGLRFRCRFSPRRRIARAKVLIGTSSSRAILPPEGAALVPELHGLLQLLRIERSPLGAAHTPSIRQCRWPA